MNIDAETATTELQTGDTDRVNDVLDGIEDAETAEKARLLSESFDDCLALYDDADDGYVRQAVVRFLATADPHLGTASAHGDDELEPNDLNLTDDADDYRDALIEFYLMALQDEDGRVRNAAKRELKPLAVRLEMLGEQDRLDALHAWLDELTDEVSGEKRGHVVEACEQVQASARPGGLGLGSAFEQIRDEMRDSDE